MSEKRPELIVVMGVSASGKSTVGREIALRRGTIFIEGDDFHSDAARQRMANGLPLDDEMRRPWISAICDCLSKQAELGKACVLAYSGLKRAYRDPLRDLGFRTVFVHLDADPQLLRYRIAQRANHFMPANLLESQLATLERPTPDEGIIVIDAAMSLDKAGDIAIAEIERRLAENHFEPAKKNP